jgi:hypothetical protein
VETSEREATDEGNYVAGDDCSSAAATQSGQSSAWDLVASGYRDAELGWCDDHSSHV